MLRIRGWMGRRPVTWFFTIALVLEIVVVAAFLFSGAAEKFEAAVDAAGPELQGRTDFVAAYRLAAEATHMALHVVPEDRPELAELFGGETADDVDKLARVEWRPGPGDAPLIAGCPYVAGPVRDRFEVGDHVAFVVDVEVEEGSATPLPFERARAIDPGHEA